MSVDIDQFTIVDNLIILTKHTYSDIKIECSRMYELIIVGTDEPLFVPNSINNMINLNTIAFGEKTVEYININTNTLVNLEHLVAENCTNKHGLRYSTGERSKKGKCLKDIAAEINDFFKI